MMSPIQEKKKGENYIADLYANVTTGKTLIFSTSIPSAQILTYVIRQEIRGTN